MNGNGFIRLFILLTVVLSVFGWGMAQADMKGDPGQGKLNVFFPGTDQAKQINLEKIPFIQPVPEEAEAQVAVRFDSRPLESGEREFLITISGMKQFSGQEEKLKYVATRDASEEAVNSGLTQTLMLGLINYAAKLPLNSRIDISLKESVNPAAVVDKWKFWVFNISVDGYFNGEKSYQYQSMGLSLSANKTTPEIKISLSGSARYSRQEFVIDEQTVESGLASFYLDGLVVKSLDDHWSAGSFFELWHSDYSNIGFGATLAPAVEYNLFSYQQSTRKQLRFLYRLNWKSNRYVEETVFGKTSESRFQESLSVSLELKRRWGSITTSLEGSHYLHDFSKNRLDLFTYLDIKLIRGFSFYIFASGSVIHDQLALSSNISDDDILLGRKQLPTNYNYFCLVGVGYSFGAINSNVVNPRFGSTSSGGLSVSVR